LPEPGLAQELEAAAVLQERARAGRLEQATVSQERPQAAPLAQAQAGAERLEPAVVLQERPRAALQLPELAQQRARALRLARARAEPALGPPGLQRELQVWRAQRPGPAERESRRPQAWQRDK
jgi:hypothetical protein